MILTKIIEGTCGRQNPKVTPKLIALISESLNMRRYHTRERDFVDVIEVMSVRSD